MKLTKIVCTIGPASGTKEQLGLLIDAGMNVARLNFSHGDHGEKATKVGYLKQLIGEKQTPVALLLDTKGPEIRTCKLEGGQPVALVAGQDLLITYEDILGNSQKISLTYKDLHRDVSVWTRILISDGTVVLRVKKILDKDVLCTVVNTTALGERKNVNLPGVKVNLPVLEQKDIEDLIFGCEQGIDYVAASFIRKARDVQEVRALLDAHNGQAIKIISKIENQEGLDNFEEILIASDGIMVARWDLWMEIPMQDLPHVQKMMIKRCNEMGKIVITATQMFDSMIKNPLPTRAEVTDVANAILDGTDAVMLSGETANGTYPVEAVTMMADICRTTDPKVLVHDIHEIVPDDFTTAIAKAAVDTAQTLGAACIVTSSYKGRTARKIRKYFPWQPIIVLTPNEQVARQTACVKGCFGVVIDESIDNKENHELLYQTAKHVVKELGFAKTGDIIIVTSGINAGILEWEGKTNSLKVMKV